MSYQMDQHVIRQKSRFNTEVPFSVQTLAQTVQDSAQSNNEKSYTKYLLTEGIEKITKKYGEEAFEVVFRMKCVQKKHL